MAAAFNGLGGVLVTDWMTTDTAFEADSSSTLVKPPILFLGVTAAVAIVSLASFFFNNSIGYGFAVLASLVGGFTALQDQKRRGNSNYVSLGWFRSGLRGVRFAIVAIAFAHIVALAINAANGGGLF